MKFNKNIKLLLNFTTKKEFKGLMSNFSFLFLINIANYIFPLLTIPYLVRVLGIEKFGLLSFATSIIAYFVILSDYGFNLSATKEISIFRNDKDKINEIFSSVIILKVIIMLIGFIILLPIIFLTPKFNAYWYIFIFSYGNVLGQLLFPVWFFQGLEKMKIISILNFISKCIFTVAIFVFIKKESDFFLVPIFSSMGFIAIGVVSLLIVFFKYKVSFIPQNINNLYRYLKDGWSLFISNISVTLYTTTTITFLGFYTNNSIVGYYSVADKIISVIRSVISPISQVLFPYLCNLSQKTPQKVLDINKKLAIYGGVVMLVGSIAIYFFASNIMFLIFHKKDLQSIEVLKILAIIPFLTFLHTVFALFTMIVFGKNKEYRQIIVSAAILNLVLCSITIPLFGFIGAAIASVIVETYLLFRYVFYTENHNLKIFGRRSNNTIVMD
jgi:PST family polysaccharide transporter